jgi:hypothetical protein
MCAISDDFEHFGCSWIAKMRRGKQVLELARYVSLYICICICLYIYIYIYIYMNVN